MGKYTIKDIERGIEYLKTNCGAIYVRMEISDLGRLKMFGSDSNGQYVTIIIFDESTQKMPELQRTERL